MRAAHWAFASEAPHQAFFIFPPRSFYSLVAANVLHCREVAKSSSPRQMRRSYLACSRVERAHYSLCVLPAVGREPALVSRLIRSVLGYDCKGLNRPSMVAIHDIPLWRGALDRHYHPIRCLKNAYANAPAPKSSRCCVSPLSPRSPTFAPKSGIGG